MKRYMVTVLIECGKESFAEEIEVEAEDPSPGATTAAFNIAYAKHKGKGYRFSFGGIDELQGEDEGD